MLLEIYHNTILQNAKWNGDSVVLTTKLFKVNMLLSSVYHLKCNQTLLYKN